jgi:hypothetical protein
MPVDKQRALQRQKNLPEHLITSRPSETIIPNTSPNSSEAAGNQTTAHVLVKQTAAPAARRFSSSAPPQDAKCGALTKELLQKYAVSNTVMITVNDIVTVQALGRHWLRNVNAASITNWLMVATDQATVSYLESLGVSRCVMLPGTEGRAKADQAYKWHDLSWVAATWRNTEASAQVGTLPPGACTVRVCQGWRHTHASMPCCPTCSQGKRQHALHSTGAAVALAHVQLCTALYSTALWIQLQAACAWPASSTLHGCC